ncbi:hypothetical protein BLNAU_2560 [Blattamonas nauphoetae]|uniref:Senescence domain-containing protein n=1 Tax=Blattamonas nauphoetae TaxID=2049346 RepID=A0ABQ9YEZ3_9EUKA|nr:hypothetical protein BLNAU_2560 [Blattamonas nauphoetae]
MSEEFDQTNDHPEPVDGIPLDGEDGLLVETEEVDGKQASVALIAAKVLADTEIRSDATKMVEADEHAGTILKGGKAARSAIETGATKLGTVVTSFGDKLAEGITPSEKPVEVGSTAENTTMLLSKGGQFYQFTQEKFASVFRIAIDTTGKQLSKTLYQKYPDTMRSPNMVKARTLLLGIVSALIMVIQAVFGFISTLVDSLIKAVTTVVGKKFGKNTGDLVGNVITILIVLFQLWLTSATMGLKGIVITLIISFLIGTLSRIEDTGETQTPSVPAESTQPATAQ